MDTPIKILVIDDNVDFIDSMKRLLSKEPYQVEVAFNGENGLQMVDAHLPDLVLLDVVMPGIDGYEVCRRIKGNPKYSGIFVVIFSGQKTSSDDQVGAIEGGADGFILRPVSNRELLARIQGFIRIIRSERVLRTSEQRYRSLFENAIEGIYQTTVEGRYIQVNPSFARMFGFDSPEEMKHAIKDIGKQLYVHPGDRERLKKLLKKHGHIENFEAELFRKNGETFWVLINAHLVFDQSGNVICIEGTNIDITERKRVEDELAEAAFQWQTTFNAVGDGICLIDNNQRILRTNKAMGELFQKTEQEMTGRYCYEIVHGTNKPMKECPILKMMETRKRESAEIKISGKWFDVTVDPCFNADGQMAGAIHLVRDITERKQAQEEVALLNEMLEKRVLTRTAELEASNRELEAFSYTVSHDLRSPLRAIDGFTNILTEEHGERLDEEGKKVCRMICENARKMGQLIDDLLAFSRLGRTGMNIAPVNMKQVIEAVYMELTTPDLRAKTDFSVDELPIVMADHAMVRQVWFNLLSNALKFSGRRDRPVIKITFQQVKDDFQFAIGDNGVGFDMKFAHKLFGVFQRLHGASEFEGTGVGLAIVNRIIQRHGGTIWGESVIDEGAKFYFTLPVGSNK